MSVFVFQPEEDYPDFEQFGPPPCTDSNPDTFFSDDIPDDLLGQGKQGKPRYAYEREAKKVCGGCKYLHECRAYAMKRPDLQGIWGGTTEKDRSKISRGLRITPMAPSSRSI